MAGGCWICNPFCGKCRPAAKKSGRCPKCDTVTIFDKNDIIAGEDLVCKNCGYVLNDLVRPKIVHCQYSGLLCAYPCGKHKDKTSEFGYQTCKLNTPPQ